MSEAKVSSKGQITLGRESLQYLGVRPGDALSVEKLPGARIATSAASPAGDAFRPTGNIADAFGMLHRPGMPCLTIEEIGIAIEEGWAGKR
jgi:hypothetical protein